MKPMRRDVKHLKESQQVSYDGDRTTFALNISRRTNLAVQTNDGSYLASLDDGFNGLGGSGAMQPFSLFRRHVIAQVSGVRDVSEIEKRVTVNGRVARRENSQLGTGAWWRQNVPFRSCDHCDAIATTVVVGSHSHKPLTKSALNPLLLLGVPNEKRFRRRAEGRELRTTIVRHTSCQAQTPQPYSPCLHRD